MVVLRTHPCVQLNFLSKFQFGLETTLTRQWVQSIWFLTRVLGMDMRDLPAEVRSAAEAHEAGPTRPAAVAIICEALHAPPARRRCASATSCAFAQVAP